jgi:broad specificity phosphatase PhoE
VAQAQIAVFLVRHADRLDWSDDAALSKAGEERAERLAKLLQHAGITVIYATEFRRTQRTAEPIAQLLKLRPVIWSHEDSHGLVKRITERNEKDIVLVVGHDSTIPRILELFGHPEAIAIAPAEYDSLFVLIPKKDSPPAVIRLRY